MKDQIHLLKTKRFLPLFITQFFGAFNDNAFKNALIIWFAYDMAIHANFNVSMVVTFAAGIFILPFFLFSAMAGQIADKYEKSRLAQCVKLVEIVLMLAGALCFFLQSIYGLLVVLFLMGVQSTFFGPIKYSLLPEHLQDDELIAGNGLIEGGTFLSILLGNIFSGLIIRTEYGVELLSICVIGFAIIGWHASRSIPKSPVGDKNLKIGWNIARETWKIIAYARQARSVWLSIMGISWFWSVGVVFLTQLPIYSKDVINGNEHVVTLFLTIFSLGIGIGSVWCNRLLKGEIHGRLVPYGGLGMTVAIMIFVLSTHFYASQYMLKYENKMLQLAEFFSIGLSSWGIVIGLLMLSIAAGIYIVPLYAIMQHRSNDQYLARVIAANNMINALLMVLVTAATLILLAQNFTVTQILLTVGLFNIPVLRLIQGVARGT